VIGALLFSLGGGGIAGDGCILLVTAKAKAG